MLIEDLPIWRDCDLQDDMIDPPMPLTALQRFIVNNEVGAVEFDSTEASDIWRKQLCDAITYSENEIFKTILKALEEKIIDCENRKCFADATGIQIAIETITEYLS